MLRWLRRGEKLVLQERAYPMDGLAHWQDVPTEAEPKISPGKFVLGETHGEFVPDEKPERASTEVDKPSGVRCRTCGQETSNGHKCPGLTVKEKSEPKVRREWYIEPPHGPKPGRAFTCQDQPMGIILYSGDKPEAHRLVRVREILEGE